MSCINPLFDLGSVFGNATSTATNPPTSAFGEKRFIMRKRSTSAVKDLTDVLSFPTWTGGTGVFGGGGGGGGGLFGGGS